MCGEEEVRTGTVDIRQRNDMDDKNDHRIGKKRVDELADYFQSFMPKPSAKREEFYGKMWKPEDYPVHPSADQDESHKLNQDVEKEEKKEVVKKEGAKKD